VRGWEWMGMELEIPARDGGDSGPPHFRSSREGLQTSTRLAPPGGRKGVWAIDSACCSSPPDRAAGRLRKILSDLAHLHQASPSDLVLGLHSPPSTSALRLPPQTSHPLASARRRSPMLMVAKRRRVSRNSAFSRPSGRCGGGGTRWTRHRRCLTCPASRCGTGTARRPRNPLPRTGPSPRPRLSERAPPGR